MSNLLISLMPFDSYVVQTPSMYAGAPLRQSMLPNAQTVHLMHSLANSPLGAHLSLARQHSFVDAKDKYKTELCIPYMEHGKCEQVNCQFAHGDQDLRTVQRDANYKTVLCKNFHSSSGFCKHGSRCTYIHNEPPKTPQFLANRFRRTSELYSDGDSAISSENSCGPSPTISRSPILEDDHMCDYYSGSSPGSGHYPGTQHGAGHYSGTPWASNNIFDFNVPLGYYNNNESFRRQ